MSEPETGDDGRPRITGEKGGATLDGEVLHELPPAYAAIRAALNPPALPALFPDSL